MKLKKILIFILSALLILSFLGCGQSSPGLEKPLPSEPQDIVSPASAVCDEEKRTITDLGGNRVLLPPANEIKRAVIISPPVTSVLLGVIPDSKMIVGVNSRTFTTANTEIVGKLFPNWSNVETAFVSKGFVSNTEELLNLDPDIVFYYGESQKSGIENLDIPIVDFMVKRDNNPETVSIAWDNLMRKIFDDDGSISLEREWYTSNQKVQELLSKYTGEKKSALFLFSNMGGLLQLAEEEPMRICGLKRADLIMRRQV